jgi:hypothetical protein
MGVEKATVETTARIAGLMLLSFVALAANTSADRNPGNTGSPIHMIPCSIEKVNECLAQESASGYVAIHIATIIKDRPRSKGSGGFGLVSSEDPVLVTQRSNVPKRQTVAIIDDLAKREPQLNQAGAIGMRLLPSEIAALRSWSAGASEGGGFGLVRDGSAGGVSVDGYAILLEEVPAKRFEYKIVDVADKAAPGKLKKLVSERYRAIAIVAPAILVMERGSENVSKVDEYRILQDADAQHLGPELTKAAVDGFRIVTTGASTTGVRTLVLLERVADDKRSTEYQVFSSYDARELEKQLNEAAQKGYSPVPGGIVPTITQEGNDRGMTTPPQRVEVVVGKTVGLRYATFKVLNFFGKDTPQTIDTAMRDGYEFVEFVGLMNDNLVILGHSASSSAPNKDCVGAGFK